MSHAQSWRVVGLLIAAASLVGISALALFQSPNNWAAEPASSAPAPTSATVIAPAPQVPSWPDIFKLALTATTPTATMLTPTTGPTVAVLETTPAAVPLFGPVAPAREIDEGKLVDAFQEMDLVKSLLAPGRVHFLYSSRGRPDPMLIPWVHIEIISMERLNEAQSLLQAADRLADPRQKEVCYKLALEELKRVQAEDTTGRYAEKAKEIEKRVNDLIRQIPAPGATPTPVATKRPELPQEIVANTRGVVYDETPKRDHVVLIADEVLRVNQSPRGHPEVRIARIERGAVTFVFDSTSATITVETEVSFGRR